MRVLTVTGPGRRLAPIASLMCALVFTAACSGTSSTTAKPTPAASTDGSARTEASTMASPSSTWSPVAAVPSTVMGKRCGQPDVLSSSQVLQGPGGARLTVSDVGSGGTVALLLHQTDRVAACGWWPFATRLAAAGVRSEMLDFCRFGTSTCSGSFADDYPAQVLIAAKHLRATGAHRLVLVGASLGGTVAVNSAAASGADAVVDLSGFGYGPLVTARPLAALRIPVLAAASPDDNPDSARLAAEVAASAAPVKRFIPVTAGHGWSMVLDGPFADSGTSDLGRTIINWAKGDTGS